MAGVYIDALNNPLYYMDSDGMFADAVVEQSSGSRSKSGSAMSNSSLSPGEKKEKAAGIISASGEALGGVASLINSITGNGTPQNVYYYGDEDNSSRTILIIGAVLLVAVILFLVLVNRK